MEAKELIDEIVQKVQDNANVKVVFGEPIQQEGTMIIPVAKVSVQGGGGGGYGPDKRRGKDAEAADNPEKDAAGMGLGVSVRTVPLGYIEIVEGEAYFQEIVDRTKLMMTGMVLAGFVALVLGKLFRR
jgi:uncharacterized spore protein YtfJ